MVYSFFAAKASSLSPPSLPTTASTNRNNNKIDRTDLKQGFKSNSTSIPPTNIITPPPLNTTKSTSVSKADPALQNATPYPHLAPSISTPHPQVTIDQVKTAHVPSLMRITGLLLPVRYPNSFYTATITDPVIASLSRVAIFHDHPTTNVSGATFSTTATNTSSDKVIGGIRCRLEPTTPFCIKASSIPKPRPTTNLYIQTLHLLSPYRGRGIATSLLDSLIYDDVHSDAKKSSSSSSSARDGNGACAGVSKMVKFYNIRTVTAHVHESNEEALSWYSSRGFTMQEGVVEGYYRRLKPGGAKIVRLDLRWDDDEEGENESDDPTTEPKIDPDDDDWEKVELYEPTSKEKLDDYQNIERSALDMESISKRIRMG